MKLPFYGGIDLPIVGLPHMICQSKSALRVGICEITHSMGVGIDLPTLGLPNIICQIR